MILQLSGISGQLAEAKAIAFSTTKLNEKLKGELTEAKKQIKYLESKIVRKASCCEKNERELKEAKAELEKLREEKKIRETAMKDSNF